MLCALFLCNGNYMKGFCYNTLTTSAKISLASRKNKSKTINTILKSLYNNMEQENSINRTSLDEAVYGLLLNESII